jgi:hypothetical protein
MKYVIAAAAVVFSLAVSSANAQTFGIGLDHEQKHGGNGISGSTTDFFEAFASHKFKSLYDVKVRFLHRLNLDTQTTDFNDLKISRSFKLPVDNFSGLSLVPSISRRWCEGSGSCGKGDKSKTNIKLQLVYKIK